jgi:hypothetical protein
MKLGIGPDTGGPNPNYFAWSGNRIDYVDLPNARFISPNDYKGC